MITLIFAGWYRMTVMRRELPGSTWREFETEVIYRVVARGFSFRARPIRSVCQRGPDEARQLACHGGGRNLRWTAACGLPSIGPIQPMLSGPGMGDRVGRRIALSLV